MTKARGLALQNALARYLQQWWPLAESTGSGRTGTDVTNTPGVCWECKTAVEFKRDFKPKQWVAQCRGHGGAHHVVVYFPVGMGEGHIEEALAIMPLGQAMKLLQESGWAPPPQLPGSLTGSVTPRRSFD